MIADGNDKRRRADGGKRRSCDELKRRSDYPTRREKDGDPPLECLFGLDGR